MQDGDAVIFMNFRADRAREITRAFVDDGFDGFERKQRPALSNFVMTTEYAGDIDAPCAYPPGTIVNSFGEFLEKQNKTQLRIAETEKYAHVTFFFSGGREDLYNGEDRELVASPDVATYDLKPEMSAPEVTEKLVEAIQSGKYDAIICNYANGDMVGHTGDFNAAVKAVEAVDACLAKVADAVNAVGGQEVGQAHTQHTCELVPFIYIGDKHVSMENGGKLADVAPTMLALMGMEQPAEMTGHSLAKF